MIELFCRNRGQDHLVGALNRKFCDTSFTEYIIDDSFSLWQTFRKPDGDIDLVSTVAA